MSMPTCNMPRSCGVGMARSRIEGNRLHQYGVSMQSSLAAAPQDRLDHSKVADYIYHAMEAGTKQPNEGSIRPRRMNCQTA
jgi:hypothetical protein